MKNYEVWFEVFGKKMKTTVTAENKVDAKIKVSEKIKFHKIEIKKEDVFNDCVDMLDGMNNFLTNLK